MLSKPQPESSCGKSSAEWKSTPSRSRTVLLYSARFRRRAVTTTGVGLQGCVGAVELMLKPVFHLPEICCGGARQAFGKHLTEVQFLQNTLEFVAVLGDGIKRGAGPQIEATGFESGVVAGTAVLREEGLGGDAEGLSGGDGRALGTGHDGGEQQGRKAVIYGSACM